MIARRSWLGIDSADDRIKSDTPQCHAPIKSRRSALTTGDRGDDGAMRQRSEDRRPSSAYGPPTKMSGKGRLYGRPEVGQPQ
jgi:hypothetical protein